MKYTPFQLLQIGAGMLVIAALGLASAGIQIGVYFSLIPPGRAQRFMLSGGLTTGMMAFWMVVNAHSVLRYRRRLKQLPPLDPNVSQVGYVGHV